VSDVLLLLWWGRVLRLLQQVGWQHVLRQLLRLCWQLLLLWLCWLLLWLVSVCCQEAKQTWLSSTCNGRRGVDRHGKQRKVQGRADDKTSAGW
jgi:hypothetical protein